MLATVPRCSPGRGHPGNGRCLSAGPALHETADYQEAFRHYEQQMQPHVREQQKHARGLAKSFVPKSTLGILAQHVMMKVLLRDAWVGLLRRQFGGESLLLMQPLQDVGSDQGGGNVSPS